MPPGRLNRPPIRRRNYAADLRDIALQELRNILQDLRSTVQEFSDFMTAYNRWARAQEAEIALSLATTTQLFNEKWKLRMEAIIARDRAKIAGNEKEADRWQARYEELWVGEEKPKTDVNTIRQLQTMYNELNTMFRRDDDFVAQLGDRFTAIVARLDDDMPEMIELTIQKDAGVEVEKIEGYWNKDLRLALDLMDFMNFMRDVLDFMQRRMASMSQHRWDVSEELEHMQMQLARHSAELYSRQSGRQGRRRGRGSG